MAGKEHKNKEMGGKKKWEPGQSMVWEWVTKKGFLAKRKSRTEGHCKYKGGTAGVVGLQVWGGGWGTKREIGKRGRGLGERGGNKIKTGSKTGD